MFRNFVNLFLAGVVIWAIAGPATAEPIIGMGFPPVADTAQRNFTKKALANLNVRDIRIAENWRRRGMDPTFGPLEQRISDLHSAGLRILLTVQSNGPDAACAKRNAHSCLIKPDAPFEEYLVKLLAAVGDNIDAIQFGNEWDNQFVGTPAEFLELHTRFARVVRRERPDLTIVLGGITGRAAYAQALCVDQTPVAIPGIDLEAEVQRFCRKQAAQNARATTAVKQVLGGADFDVADIHLYDTEDLWPAAVSWFASQARGRPIWVTEFGGPEPNLEPSNPGYHAKRLREYLRVIKTLPVARAYYFKLTDDDGSIHKRSGLFDRRGNPKPALAVFKELR